MEKGKNEKKKYQKKKKNPTPNTPPPQNIKGRKRPYATPSKDHQPGVREKKGQGIKLGELLENKHLLQIWKKSKRTGWGGGEKGTKDLRSGKSTAFRD